MDKDKVDKIKETLVKKQEELVAQGVYVVPTGNYVDKEAITYKLNMLQYQQQLNSPEKLNSILLNEFHCDQVVQGCEFQHSVKAHLMMLRSKEGLPLFLAVEYVKPQGGASRGMIHFLKENEEEVLELVDFKEFWTKLGVMQPTTNRRRMFNKLPPNAIECKQNWNFTDTPVEDVLFYLTVKNSKQESEIMKPTYLDKLKVGMKKQVPKQTSLDGWAKKVQEEAKAMVKKVELRMQAVETKIKEGAVKTKALTQKVDQHDLKLKHALEVSKEHTVQLTAQSEEIENIKKIQEKMENKVDSVKEDTTLTNSKLDEMMKLLMNQNLKAEEVVNQKGDKEEESMVEKGPL